MLGLHLRMMLIVGQTEDPGGVLVFLSGTEDIVAGIPMALRLAVVPGPLSRKEVGVIVDVKELLFKQAGIVNMLTRVTTLYMKADVAVFVRSGLINLNAVVI